MTTQQISRRTLVAGLAVAPIAGLPAVAGALPNDPVLAALAELENVRARVKTIGKAHSIAEEAYYESQPGDGLIDLDGNTRVLARAWSHEQIDSHFDNAGLPDENVRAIIKQTLAMRRRPLSPADAARQAAHAELDRILEKIAEGRARSGFDDAEAAWNEAVDAESEAVLTVFAIEPTTKAGALALLRFVADLDYITGYKAEIPDAIRNAVAILEREALA